MPPEIIITEHRAPSEAITEAEAEQIATAAETVAQAAEAAVALAEVQAAETIADVREDIAELESSDQWQEQRIADLEAAALALTAGMESMHSQLNLISDQVAALTAATIIPEAETAETSTLLPESESESLEVTQESPAAPEAVAEVVAESPRPRVRLV